MNPDDGTDAEDWFAKFEREAREAARKRDEPAPAPGGDQPGWDQPTQAMATQPDQPVPPPVVQPPAEQPTQALVPAAIRFPGEEPESALDSLFGDNAFREYLDGLGPDPSNAPFAKRGTSKELVAVGGDGPPPPPPQLGALQKALIGVGAGLLGIIVLIALFLLGMRLPDLLGPAPAVATPTPTPTPTITALPIGPVAAGATYAWDELLGGECLDPYVDAWQQEYTVVDCVDPHPAQLVYRAWFPNPDADPADPRIPQTVRPGSTDFPGVEDLQGQIAMLCSAAGVVDLAAAGAYADAQIQGSYPVTEEQWDTDPSYYCFVSRSSGEPLTGSVAVPRAPAQPAPPG